MSIFKDIKTALKQAIDMEQMKRKGYDYYIEDSLGGVHTDGVGYAPDGTFCGECTSETCEGCWDEEDMMWNRRED
jgi:hypothetical protein